MLNKPAVELEAPVAGASKLLFGATGGDGASAERWREEKRLRGH